MDMTPLDPIEPIDLETKSFYGELTKLLNVYCCENESDTPDWILATYINGALTCFNKAVNLREKYYGRKESLI